MDKRKNHWLWLTLLVLGALLAACGPLEQRLADGTQVAMEAIAQDGSGGGGDEPVPSVDTDALATSIQASLEALATATPTLAETLEQPIRPTMTEAADADDNTPTATNAVQFTALAQTLAAIETGTATPTNTVAPTVTDTPAVSNTPNPSASPTPVPCLAFRFVAHVTYTPGAQVPPSSTFFKSWQVQNTGTCTWNGEYALVYDGGFQLGGASPLPLGSGVSVAPGQYVTLTIQLWSNPQPGTYSGTWLLQDDDGNKFGGGANQDVPLEVRIVVPGDPTPEFTSPASTAPPFYTSTPTP